MKKKLLPVWILLILLPLSAIGFERRQPQYADESSYLIIPMPYSIPGIGQGIMYTGLAANIAGSYADLFAINITGDAEGTIVGLFDIHILSEMLVFDGMAQLINSASRQYYEERGMDADKEDFRFQEVNKYDYRLGTLTFTLFDRRFELFAGMQTELINLIRIRDNAGEILFEPPAPIVSEAKTTITGVLLDITDDRSDPRIGIRVSAERRRTPPESDNDPDYFVENYSGSIYIPVGDDSTWAFNYQTSEAVVTRQGSTDTLQIAIEQGLLSCIPLYATCNSEEKKRVDAIVTARTYGTAKTLGGDQIMRAYPGGRFAGAHMLYYSTEFRWNFMTDVVPINFWIWQDIATSMQLAFFHEVGSVAELKENLGEQTRSSSGIGFRMISASGFVYRADYAFSADESATTVMVAYPW